MIGEEPCTNDACKVCKADGTKHALSLLPKCDYTSEVTPLEGSFLHPPPGTRSRTCLHAHA